MPIKNFSVLHFFTLNRKLWFTKKSLPGDVLLADCSFNIHEAAGMYCAKVKLSPYSVYERKEKNE